MKQHRVIAELESGQQVSLLLGDGTYVIGRESACDIHLPSDSVSRKHAKIELRMLSAVLEDLGSTGGTSISDKPVVGPTRLPYPAKFSIGPVQVTIAAEEAEPASESKAKVEHYSVGREIAKGGMGAILEANDDTLKRRVAMKIILSSEWASETELEDSRRRFVREALVLARLEHPNIVPIHEMGHNRDGQIFYTMKMVNGRTLQAILSDIRKGDELTLAHYTLDRLLGVFLKICDAIAFAHYHRIIHRDLKPENIMVGEFGEVLVMDWGLAKLLDDADENKKSDSTRTDEIKELSDAELSAVADGLTMDGAIMGSPQYMPPEQADGRLDDLGARSDIYSLGGILYTILTLHPPVKGRTVTDVLFNVKRGKIIPPIDRQAEDANHEETSKKSRTGRNANRLPHCPDGRVPAALSAVTMRAMRTRRKDRFANVGQLVADIEAYQSGFATSAEAAGKLTRLRLLLLRNRTFTAILLLLAFAVMPLVRQLRTHTESARQLQAKVDLAAADEAHARYDAETMRRALERIPADLRAASWKYLSDKAKGSTATIPGIAPDDIHSMVPDPTTPGVVAVADRFGKVTLVDIADGRRLDQFAIGLPTSSPSGRKITFRLAFSPDGERVAILNSRTNAVIHRVSDGEQLTSLKSPFADQVDFSPDGNLVMLQSRTYVSVLNAEDGKTVWRRKVSAKRAFLRDGRIFSAQQDGALHILSATDGTGSSFESRPNITTLAASPQENLVVIGHEDGAIRAIEPDSRKVRFENFDPQRLIQFIRFSGDGRSFVTMGLNPHGNRPSLKLWDTQTGRLVRSFLTAGQDVQDLQLHPISGDVFLRGNLEPHGGSDNNTVIPMWKLPNTATERRFTQLDRNPLGYFLGTESRMIIQANSGHLKVIDTETGKDLWQKESSPGPQVSLSRDHSHALVYLRSQGLTLLRLGNSAGPEPVTEKEVTNLRMSLAKISPDGSGFTYRRSYTNLVVRTFVNSEGEKLTADVGTVRDFVLADEGRRLVSVGSESNDIGDATRTLMSSQPAPQDKDIDADLETIEIPSLIYALAAQPGGSLVAEAGVDRLVRVRDSATLEILHEFRAHDDTITALAWHPTGSILATASSDLSIKVWSLKPLKMLEEFTGPTDTPISLNFSPSGTLLSCGARDRTVHVWRLKSR